MRLSLSLTLALASASAVLGSALPPSASMPVLSDFVKRDLLTRDPSSYTMYGQSNESSLYKRAPPNNLYGVRSQCTTPSCFGITFDDGPYDDQQFVSDTISQAGYKATYFVNGNNWKCIYDEDNVQRLRHSYAQGHQICSHTWSHPNLVNSSPEQIDRQVQLVEDALWKIIGAVPSCIRAPFGSTNDAVVQRLNGWGYAVIGWTADSGDTAAPEASVDSQLNQYRFARPPQQVVMLHHEIRPRTTRDIIPQAVQILRQNGYSSEAVNTIPAIFGFNGYKVVGSPSQRDASWTCADKPGPGQG